MPTIQESLATLVTNTDNLVTTVTDRINTMTTQVSTATTKASEASSSATDAQTAQTAAETAQTAAETAQTAAETALASTENVFDQFGDQYLGSKASDPTTDNDGDALTEGDIYYNTADGNLRFWTGSAWTAPEAIATTQATNASNSATAAATSASEAAASAVTAAGYVPSVTGHTGKFLSNNGSLLSWETVDATPAGVSNQENTSNTFFDLPAGTTAQRPGSPTTGNIRFNSDTNLAEYYDGTNWKSIDSPPVITSIDTSLIQSDSGSTTNIAITGSLFASGAVTKAIGTDGTTITANTTTVNSQSQIVANFTDSSFDNAKEPYDIQVTNTSGLSATLDDVLNVNASPTWSTTAGNIATVIEDEAMSSVTVSASDPDGETLTYSITSGALPTGVSLNSSTGVISGTPNANGTYASGGVTHSFDISATDTNSTSTARSFNILRKWRDGSSSSLAANSSKFIKNLTGTSSDGLYWIDVPGQGAKQIWCDMNTDGGGWTLVFKYHNYNTNNFVWPTNNTYHALPTGNPRSSSYGQTNGNLPNKYSAYGATSGANATQCLFEQYDYSDGNATYIYRGEFTSTIGNYWQSGNWHSNNNGSNEFMPSNMTQTNIVDRCGGNGGTRPTTDSTDGNRFNDKASPGSNGNWDIGGMVSGSDSVGLQGANCGRHGESGGGSHRDASVLIWVR